MYRAGFSQNINKVIVVAFSIVMLWGVFATFYLSLFLAWPHLEDMLWWAGIIGTIVTAGSIAACYPYSVKFFGWLGGRLVDIPTWSWLTGCILIGWMARIILVALFPVEFISDGLTYFGLAKGIVENGQYFTAQTHAYWPPGFPFSLVPGIYLFGAKPWVPILNNLVLYAGTLVVVHYLACQLKDEIVARIATLIVVIWPSYFLLSGTPSKEILATFLMPLAVLCYLKGAEILPSRKVWKWQLFAGLTMGACILVQPSTILFPSVFLVFELCSRARPLDAGRRMALLALGIILVVSPWTIRNYIVLDAFVPVGTAGGFSLLVGNNPKATGGYVKVEKQKGEFPTNEVAAGKFAKEKAIQWIKSNPKKFLELIPKKQILLLGDDGGGAANLKAYFTRIEYMLVKGFSNLYWILLLSIIFISLLFTRREKFLLDPRLTILMLPILYIFCIHSITESGARHHTVFIAFLAILVAVLLISRMTQTEKNQQDPLEPDTAR